MSFSLITIIHGLLQCMSNVTDKENIKIKWLSEFQQFHKVKISCIGRPLFYPEKTPTHVYGSLMKMIKWSPNRLDEVIVA